MSKVESATSSEPGVKSAWISSVSASTVTAPLELVSVKMTTPNGKSVEVSALPDTGANISAICPKLSSSFGYSANKLDDELRKPRAADGNLLQTIGSLPLSVQLGEHEMKTDFFVIKGLERPILLMQVLKDLRLIPREFPLKQLGSVSVSETGVGPEFDALVNEFPRVFDGKCKIMKAEPYHIDLEAGVVPVNTGASKSIPEQYMPALRKEIDSLIAQGIIEQVEGATQWLHPIVVVPKKDSSDIRMCVDFTRLNRFVKRPTNPQLTPWEIVRNIPRGTKHFAVFDVLKGYHQVELDEESKALTTFMTPFGQFRYCCLPFGLSSAGDVFTLRYGSAIDGVTDG